MQWRAELTVARLSSTRAEELGILDASLASLGWPAGAMFVVRGAGGPCVHLVLDPDSPRRSP